MIFRHIAQSLQTLDNKNKYCIIMKSMKYRYLCRVIVKLRQGSGKDRQGMAVKVKGLKA